MSETLDDKIFDLAFKVLNYAIEFVNSPGYSSLRFTDAIEKIVNLALELDDVRMKSFYRNIQGKFKKQRVMSDSKTREEFLNELLVLFIDEWRK